jgi:WxcM-like, C-terminal
MLRIFEKGASLPFSLRRCFVISNVPKTATRAEHEASCEQLIVVLVGACRMTLRDRNKEVTAELSAHCQGALVHKGTWLRLDRFATGTIVLVCASEKYRPRPKVRRAPNG